MDGYIEIIFVICGILLLIGLLYLIAILAFLRKIRTMQSKVPQNGKNMPINVKTDVKQCQQCGKILLDEYGFCPRCGSDLK
jgi:Zn finger protein HypA/HybF involved in hydrogenase expression